MTLRARLESWKGVWEGTYTHLTPAGEIFDRHACRQETRLEDGRWFERIIYRWDDGREDVLDFRAWFEGENLVFDDPNFHGESHLVTDDVVVFPYHWKNRPGVNIVETIVFSTPDSRSRLWQTFEDDKLAKVTVIVEERRNGETPEIWT